MQHGIPQYGRARQVTGMQKLVRGLSKEPERPRTKSDRESVEPAPTTPREASERAEADDIVGEAPEGPGADGGEQWREQETLSTVLSLSDDHPMAAKCQTSALTSPPSPR